MVLAGKFHSQIYSLHQKMNVNVREGDKAAQKKGKVAASTGAFPKILANLGDDQMKWNGEFIFCCFAGKITRSAGKVEYCEPGNEK